MSHSLEKIGANIFDAASAPVRVDILKLLVTKGALPYTEIMFSLKLDPIRDAGKFVYHLKNLMQAGLIILDKESKKYGVTELGEMVVNFTRDIEEYSAVKRGKLFVRTSRLAIEEFARDKIAKSLTSEAGVPYELAQEIAAEAEDRLIRLKTTYLTAPLIREFVNSILIERRLEEYRHKLTRLGMPVHDVSQLFKTISEQMLDVEAVRDIASASVMAEYVLLECLPRNIADAHLSGQIHVDNLPYWILKPNEIQHDLRYFLKNGLPAIKPPRSFEAALSIAHDVFELTETEVSGEQSFDMFNVFLAPFAKGLPEPRLRDALYQFLTSTRQDQFSSRATPGLSLGLEFAVPDFLYDIEAIGLGGQTAGIYGDYVNEAGLITRLIVESALEASSAKPPFSPRLIFKLRRKALKSKPAAADLLKIHELAAKHSLPYFLSQPDNSRVNYTATGLRLNDDWTGYWETDCMRTGNMDTIFLNLPRIAYDARKNDDRFFKSVEKSLEMVVEAFKAKQKSMNERVQQMLLPLLCGATRGSPYFYDKNAAYTISFIGLNEATFAHTGSSFYRNESSMKFALDVIKEISQYARSISKELGTRFSVAQRPQDEAAGRLAELDMEKYGLSTAVVEGVRGHPYYNDMPTLPLSSKVSIDERVELESKFQEALTGGHLAPICLTPLEHSAEALVKLTGNICEKGLQFFTYTNNYSYCRKCDESFIGVLPKCSVCGSSTLTYYGRSSAIFTPLTLWNDAKRRALDKRVCYSLS